ncbi:MAG: PepSY domain-containing protein [Proteobacteria bacterium]|nr:PepSY domain-containing protein [Pseudomonadota bacterium]
MTPRALRRWTWTHTWTSLVCMVFMLFLCITGLPLIFHEEIGAATRAYDVPPMPASTPRASLDRIVSAAQAKQPGYVIQYMYPDDDNPDVVGATMGRDPVTQEGLKFLVIDNRTAQVLAEPDFQSGVMYVLLTLHTDMFAGLPGKLFLGLMGLVFIASIVSGVVVYKPYMRKLAFATVRRRTRRLYWLDLHNVLGIVTVAWVCVVGFTGVVNTWADLVVKYWQYDQMAAMTAPYRGQPPLAPGEVGSLQHALDTAERAMPGRTFAFVAFPGTPFASPHHYAVFMHGTTPLTSRLLKPALVDARTGDLTDSRDLPWYVSALLLSQPLHFGDYGGTPLKVLWALLDVVAIVVLGSGIYLWLAKRRGTRVAVLDRDYGRQPRRRGWVWTWPLVAGTASTVGLVVALAGDGWLDAISWVLVGLPGAIGVSASIRRDARPRPARARLPR